MKSEQPRFGGGSVLEAGASASAGDGARLNCDAGSCTGKLSATVATEPAHHPICCAAPEI